MISDIQDNTDHPDVDLFKEPAYIPEFARLRGLMPGLLLQAGEGKLRNYRNNKKIYSGPPRQWYVLLEGVVTLYSAYEKRKFVRQYVVEPGTLLGFETFTRSSVHKYALAEKPTSLLEISTDRFTVLSQQSPLFACWILREMAMRLSEINEPLEQLAFQRIPNQLARTLITLQEPDLQDGIPTVEGIPHRRIAADIGTYRETVSSILREFKQDGIVDTARKRIKILDLDYLHSLAEESY